MKGGEKEEEKEEMRPREKEAGERTIEEMRLRKGRKRVEQREKNRRKA